MRTPEFQFGVVLLGAGASSRMGQPKLLLPWKGTSILGHLASVWTRLHAAQIAAVAAVADQGLSREWIRLGRDPQHLILNPRPEDGMFSSIRCAARWEGWRPGLTHWIISLGDQPQVRAETMSQLLAEARRHPNHIWQPSRQSRPKHPVVLPARDFRALADSEAPHLKAYLETRSDRRRLIPADDTGLDLDLDYPKDYEAARRMDGI